MPGRVDRALVTAALCGGAAIGNNAQRSPLINTKQLDNKFPFELVFLFERHVRTPDLLTIYVPRLQTKLLKENMTP